MNSDEHQAMHGIIGSVDMSLSKLGETVKDGTPGVLQPMGSQRGNTTWSLNNNAQDTAEAGRGTKLWDRGMEGMHNAEIRYIKRLTESG